MWVLLFDFIPELVHVATDFLFNLHYIMEDYDAAFPHQRGIHKKILLDAPVGVVPIDEQVIDFFAV